MLRYCPAPSKLDIPQLPALLRTSLSTCSRACDERRILWRYSGHHAGPARSPPSCLQKDWSRTRLLRVGTSNRLRRWRAAGSTHVVARSSIPRRRVHTASAVRCMEQLSLWRYTGEDSMKLKESQTSVETLSETCAGLSPMEGWSQSQGRLGVRRFAPRNHSYTEQHQGS